MLSSQPHLQSVRFSVCCLATIETGRQLPGVSRLRVTSVAKQRLEPPRCCDRRKRTSSCETTMGCVTSYGSDLSCTRKEFEKGLVRASVSSREPHSAQVQL